MGSGHEEADVGVAAFVAAAREHDVAEAGGLCGAEGGERRGGGGVVVFARRRGFRMGEAAQSAVGVLCGLWGRRRGRGCGWRCGGRIAGRGLGSRRGRGGEARSVGPWSCGSLGRVSWGEEQGGGGGVPEKCCMANSLIVCARPMLMLGSEASAKVRV